MGEENSSLLQVATVLDTDCIYTVLKEKKKTNHQPNCKFSWLVAHCSLQYSLVTDIFLPPLNTTLKGD